MALIQSLVKSAPEIIKEAAQSPLGIVALIILVVAVVGFFFFKTDKTSIRVTIFVLMLVSFIGLFGYSAYRTTGPHLPSDDHPVPIPSPRSDGPVPTVTPTPDRQVVSAPAIIVWVNTDTGIYHCPGTQWYARTKHGKYMRQKEAQEQRYKPAYGRPCQ
jgi:hypothetical protein